METRIENRMAYDIIPAIRMSAEKGVPWLITLDTVKKFREASRSKKDFERWLDAEKNGGVKWLGWSEEDSNEKILGKIREMLKGKPGKIMLKNLGLLNVSSGYAGTKTTPVSGKIVVVTGAAQGFGKGLAGHFASDGAYVVVADINRETGKETVRELKKKSGNERLVFLPVDVTDSDSMDNLIRQTVFSFGGLDLFISNAGVLKAGGLESLREEDFDFLTNVNYKGLYLGTKYASRVMKTQHKYLPGYFMDIIQINSKSGLQGSNRNFAYAGSKFGSIGLIQSFALELVPDNIKVNAVCPGNFFDGPLWSHPETGLFIQYLKAGKVPGAKTIEDVRKHYENMVPMKRGCFVEDVYKAVKYLVDQEYETGQALPVTGGQVMLK